MKSIFVFVASGLLAFSALAKLPALSDDAKAKAAEAAAKTAYTGKLEGYQLCKSQDRVASQYRNSGKAAGKPTSTPPCADPGPFVYTAAAAPAPAAAPAGTPAPAAPEKKKKKKS
jgi:hypothetical protein